MAGTILCSYACDRRYKNTIFSVFKTILGVGLNWNIVPNYHQSSIRSTWSYGLREATPVHV
ncbi:hypothetical protein AUEXF2481DRAFT_45336 [Aureobasidium subglaciale EXF-2481]|uniref:Uncharacterized protein n=1 Tax=Aureobasidium subglaciale (strain EXF-2481) TaxID=1043005 RepID=A0A074XXJ7_AURSE|nr:uncharacterized protein AUEXF2481DRAFT_45336 [Aureobasidium subglaciale EXF-2481]KEQ90190.1 hypothetical protein AUEXF2481DRAFT_45336 [Aureobasidium subglaciale EXF-2481]